MRQVISGVAMFTALSLCSSCAPKKEPASVPVTTQPLAVGHEWTGIHNAACVSSVLYRGGQPTAEGFGTLKSMGIKTIVDLRGKSHLEDARGLTLVHIPTNVDRPDLKEIISFIHLTRQPSAVPVFVHDDLGANRVGLFVGAYRMVEEGWTAEDAIAELPQFKFDNFRAAVPEFLRRLDVGKVRKKLAEMPTSRPTSGPSRGK